MLNLLDSIPNVLLLGAGPSCCSPATYHALSCPTLSHMDPYFIKIMDEIKSYLQQLMNTKNELTVPLSTSGSGGMEATFVNIVERGDKILVLENGSFSERMIDVAGRLGAEVTALRYPWGEPISVEEAAAQLKKEHYKAVAMVYAETSTGVLHPVQEVAAVTRERNVLLVADGISAVSISPVRMDEWGIDCLITGSQKGLMLPPGLAFVALSPRAWKRAAEVRPQFYYFDLTAERASCEKNQTHYTSPISLLVGLHEALTMLQEMGMDNVFKKQWALTQMARTGIAAMGMELFVKEEGRYTWGLTSVRMPDDLPAGPVVAKAFKECGVILTAGQGNLKDKVLRLAHMGWIDWGDLAAGLHALAWSLPERPSGAYIEEALDAYHKALGE